MYNGNNAYELYPQKQTREVTVTRTRPQAAPKAAKRAKARRKAQPRAVQAMLLCAVLVLAVFTVVSTANADILKNEVVSLENQLDQVQSEVAQKQVALEKSVDLKQIEEIATNELGMQKPENYQKVYITVTQPDAAVVYESAKTNANGFLGFISSAFTNIKEYLFH